MQKKTFSPEELRYLKLLAREYPTVQAASTEIINLQAILNLPKGTEHFISDIHGEYEAFLHILNSCSGVIKEKLDEVFASSIPRAERDQLATLIYYPEEKLKDIARNVDDLDEWYRITLHRLIEVCRLVTSKYTRSKVRKALPKDYAYIIDELIHIHYDESNKRDYFENIINTIIDIGQAPGFITAVCEVIKRMAVDHMHIVGDLFDRGPRADIVLDALLDYHSGAGLFYSGLFLLNSLPDADALSSLFIGQFGTGILLTPFVFRESDFSVVPVVTVICLGLFQVGLAFSPIMW